AASPGEPPMSLRSTASHAWLPRLGRRAGRSLLLAATLLVPSLALAQAQPAGESGYRTPVAELQAIVDAPRAPQLTLGPKRDIAAMVQVPDLPGIDVVAQPELKLGGLRIHPQVHARSVFSLGSDLWLAFNRLDRASGANELWLVDTAVAKARRVASGL